MTAKRKAKPKKAKSAKGKIAQKAEVKDNKAKTKAKIKRFEVEFYRDWCKGCGICVAFCPEEVLAMNEKGEPEISKPERCIGCAWCEIRCPDFAVRVEEKKEEEVCEA